VFEPPPFYPDPVAPEPVIEVPPSVKEEILRKESQSKDKAYKINPDDFLREQQMQQLAPPEAIRIE
jgi:hypothetical protein